MSSYLFMAGLALIFLLSIVLWATANIDLLEEKERELREEIDRIEKEQRKIEGDESPST
jgi:hypothetical protein